MKLTYYKLRENFINYFSAFPKIDWKKSVSIVNDAYSGNFNLSFNEPEHLETFGNYVDYNKRLAFGKIQPVIRHEDFLKKILPNKDAYKYLGLFEMGGISISEPDKSNWEEITRQLIEKGYNFLIRELGLDPSRLFIKISSGGNIRDISESKYNFDWKIPPDNFSATIWQELGFNIHNIIYDSSRDTFLALHLFRRASPWGYRTEILYNIGKDNNQKNLLDIGTFEYCLWKPIIKKGEIVNIVQNKSFSALMVFGLERLLVAKNNYIHIKECNHIQPLYEKIVSNKTQENIHKSFVLTEAIRVIHRVLTDSKKYTLLGKHRQKRLTDYLRAIYHILITLNIPEKEIEKYLDINAELNPYYPELKENIEPVYNEIIDSFRRKFGRETKKS